VYFFGGGEGELNVWQAQAPRSIEVGWEEVFSCQAHEDVAHMAAYQLCNDAAAVSHHDELAINNLPGLPFSA
jgi:hypothetical protein